ncbi:MAG TPA: tetratricopeptide repeat protein [Gemmatimonadales bacterium]|nr:tetratricopeptide repeat protein [Gemmatimonadales bacterium]
MIKIGVGAALVLATAGTAWAQEPAAQGQPTLAQQVAQQTANASGGKLRAPECSADNGLHFKVKSGKTYLNTAFGVDEARRQHILENAQRVITEAITQNGQDKSAGAWYYLGWADLALGDVAGADSSLTRAEALAPDCKADIAKLRMLPYAPLFNQGINFSKAGQTDSAMAYFRRAASVNPSAPEAPYSLAGIYLKQQQPDSAIVYFQKAIAAATTPDRANMRNEARYNLAVTLVQQKRDKEAVPVLQAYLQEKPNDVDARKALAVAFRGAGMADSAKAIEAQLLNASTGASAGGAGGGALGSGDVFAIGVQRYQEKNYAEAAKAFSTVVQQEPFNRDALYNLANAYYAMKDAPNLTKTAERLVAIDPMNEDVLKLQAAGYQMAKNQTLQMKVAERLFSLPTSIKVESFQPTASGATLTATATGRKAQTLSGAAVKPEAGEVEFEFLDKTGNVVNTQKVEVPALTPGQSQPLTVTAQGAGIVAWRYHEAGAKKAGAAAPKKK